MSSVLSEWKPAAVITVGVALVTVETTALWITGNHNCVVNFCLLLVALAVSCLCNMLYIFLKFCINTSVKSVPCSCRSAFE